MQRFIFPFFQELAAAELQQVSPTDTTYETGTFDFSGSGEVTGAVVPIDVRDPAAAGAELDLRLRGGRLPARARPSRRSR